MSRRTVVKGTQMHLIGFSHILSTFFFLPGQKNKHEDAVVCFIQTLWIQTLSEKVLKPPNYSKYTPNTS